MSACQAAFGRALTATSTDDSPWYVVPADHKWHRNVTIASILVDHLRATSLTYPQPPNRHRRTPVAARPARMTFQATRGG